MKVTKVAVDKIYPVVQNSLSKSANVTAYKKNIEDFIKARSNDLYDTVPMRRIPFLAEDIDSYANFLTWIEEQK